MQVAHKTWANNTKKMPRRTLVASTGTGAEGALRDPKGGCDSLIASLIIEPLKPTKETPPMTMKREAH